VTLDGGHDVAVRQPAISAVEPPAVGTGVRLGLAPADTIIVPQEPAA
jgi:hypothetical protein